MMDIKLTVWHLVLCLQACWIITQVEAEISDSKLLTSTKTFSVFKRRTRQPTAKESNPKCDCTCGETNDATRIVGGQPTEVNQYPWMARLSYFGRFYCAGTLINDRYVLTAAHCVKGRLWFLIKVTFGEYDRCDNSAKPESRFVIRAIVGDFTFSNFDNDIALLRLNDRVPIVDIIKPVCLPSVLNDTYKGVQGVIMGWGTLEEAGRPACIIRDAEVPVLSNEYCRTKTNYTAERISDNMMCAGYEQGMKDSCQGDSGGPMVLEREDSRYEIIGIVSWGAGCGRAGYPGVYTRVTRYVEWIREKSKEGCFCKY